MKKRRNILVTCAGGHVYPEIIENIRNHKDYDFRIVGCDTSELAVGYSFSDAYYTVPKGNESGYPGEILRICKKEDINYILPLSDEESLALSFNKELFLAEAAVPIVSDYEAVSIACDKGNLLEHLKLKGIQTPRFFLPDDYEQLLQGIKELGYPKKKVVFKQRTSRGGRGFNVISDNFRISDRIGGRCDHFLVDYTEIMNAFKEEKNIQEYLLMEYLPGKDYNIDVLFLKGVPELILSNQRLKPKAGPVNIGKLESNQQVIDVVNDIAKVLTFDYCINIEAAFGDDGKLYVYEINPRVGAPIVFYTLGGIDMLNLMMSYVIDNRIRIDRKVCEDKFCYRYWKTKEANK
ncbi:MAG TPA: ATP-grasp domain-containing protein [Gammaproteobacteria bacterium]|nr:ATP-grasp domain-containing protein [Gammaproteobacteria bacterium]